MLGLCLILFVIFLIKNIFLLIVFIHELGHTLIAKLVKIPIEYVCIGNNDSGYIESILFHTSFRFGKMPISFKMGPSGFTNHSDVEVDILKYVVYALGGVLFSLIFAFIGFLSLYFLWSPPQKNNNSFLLWALYSLPFIYSYFELMNLVPRRRSDGWHIRKLLELRRKGLKKIIYHTFPVPMHYQSGDFTEIIDEGTNNVCGTILSFILILISLNFIFLKITHGDFNLMAVLFDSLIKPSLTKPKS
jgi:hypothetical protein